MRTKRFMMMMAMATMTSSAFAQTAKEQAELLNNEAKAHYEAFQNEQNVLTQNVTEKKNLPVDTVKMYTEAFAALDAMMKCDAFDAQPNEKGKVKLKYRSSNAPTAANLRISAIQGGEYFRGVGDYTNALKGYQVYINSFGHSIFEGTDLVKQDPYIGQIAYIAAFLEYSQNKNYDEAIKYAETSKKFYTESPSVSNADEIILFAKKDRCKTAEDSAAFINEIKELHKANIANQRYFNLLNAYYDDHQDLKSAWLEEEIALDPTNKMVWANKGVIEMNAEKYDEAIESYKKAMEIDPNFVQVVFNIGVCLNSKAVNLNDQLSDKKTGTITKANLEKVKVVLNEAKQYLEKAKELDPDREKVNWAYALGRVYYALGDTANYEAMEALQ